jgi:hypothetical protein
VKKKVKKLMLHRETLMELDGTDLGLAGAAATQTCYPSPCDVSRRNTCTSCQLTCTTNFC